MVSSSARTHDLNLSLEAIQAKSTAFEREIRTFDPDLQMIYAIHRQGQLQNTLRILEDRFLEHPAGRIAASIAGRGFPDHEPSAFHGLCAKRTPQMMGLQSKIDFLAVISINIDEFDNMTDILLELFRQTWLGLELTAFFRDHPNEKIPDRPLNLKRNILGEARVNLRADLFMVFMGQDEGYKSSLSDLTTRRAVQTLNADYSIKPERYPFPLIAQTVMYAVDEILPHLSPQKSRLHRYSRLISVLSNGIPDIELKRWIKFATTAQDMSWRRYPAETILGCAAHTSDDAFLRAIAHKIAEFSGLTPQSLDQISTTYNGFIDIQNNYSVHIAIIEQTFETALELTINTGNAEPFFKLARLQNEHLAQGRFIGYCASALQNAGRVYREAHSVGIAPAEAARIEFESQCYLLSLARLHKFSDIIVEHIKNNPDITFKHMIKYARDQGDVEQIAQAFEQMIHHDNTQNMMAIPHSADNDIVLEGIDPEKLYQKITQFTRMSNDAAAAPKPVSDPKKPTELALEED